MNAKWFLGSLFAVLLGSAAPAMAGSDGDKWNYSLAPLFLWGMGIEGTTSIGPVSAPLDIQFKDALDNLDGVFTIHFEAQKRDLTLFAEYQYVNLGPEAQLPNGSVVNVTFKNTMAELGAGYRVVDGDVHDFELLGGGRYTKQDLTARGIPLPPLNSISNKESWWDVFLGGRWTARLSERWKFVGRVDLGTGGSDMTSNLSGFFDYRFRDWGSVFIGYRYMDFDYEDGTGVNRYAYDATQEGPLAGLAIHW